MKFFKFILALIILTSTGCVTLKPIEPVTLEPNTSVLYVFREDSATSMSDKVNIYLNDKKATEILEFDGYKALVLKPGTYTIKFEVFNKKNELIKKKDFTGAIDPNKAYMCGIAYNFGWRGFDHFFDAEGKSIMFRFKFKGKVDLTKVIAPK
jgi:hypothetical protein